MAIYGCETAYCILYWTRGIFLLQNHTLQKNHTKSNNNRQKSIKRYRMKIATNKKQWKSIKIRKLYLKPKNITRKTQKTTEASYTFYDWHTIRFWRINPVLSDFFYEFSWNNLQTFLSYDLWLVSCLQILTTSYKNARYFDITMQGSMVSGNGYGCLWKKRG